MGSIIDAIRGARLLAALGIVVLAAAACTINVPVFAPTTTRFVSVSGSGTNFVYMLRIDGEITSEPSRLGVINPESRPGTVESVRIQLDRLELEGIKPVALLLRVNSPGGGVTASDIVYHQLMKYKERTGVPVVVLMMDVAASGGYYIAMAGDFIVAHPTTITGSLGVIVQSFNVSKLMEKYGVEDNSITSGPFKDMLSMTRPRPDAHVPVIRDLVDTMHRRFSEVIEAGRGDRLKKPIAEIADGRVYLARQAADLGLIDKVGYFDDALDEVRRLSKQQDLHVITIAALPESARGNLYMSAPAPQPGFAPGSVIRGITGKPLGGFYYLWTGDAPKLILQ